VPRTVSAYLIIQISGSPDGLTALTAQQIDNPDQNRLLTFRAIGKMVLISFQMIYMVHLWTPTCVILLPTDTTCTHC